MKQDATQSRRRVRAQRITDIRNLDERSYPRSAHLDLLHAMQADSLSRIWAREKDVALECRQRGDMGEADRHEALAHEWDVKRNEVMRGQRGSRQRRGCQDEAASRVGGTRVARS